MKIPQLLLTLFIMFFSYTAMSQSFDGIWKGTSICQLKNSPCHDENVVYYVSKDSTGKTFETKGYKIINGQEDFMGTLIFTYDNKQDTYVSVDKERSVKWEFKMTGRTIKGVLFVNGALFRVIDVKKTN